METYDFTTAYKMMKEGKRMIPTYATGTVLKFSQEKQAIVLDIEIKEQQQEIVMPMNKELLEAEYVEQV